MPATKPLSPFDAAILAAETSTQHMQVVATLLLDTSGTDVGFRAFQDRIAERYRLVEPMRRRLQSVPFGDPVWVDDPGIHVPSHLHHVELAGGGLRALARITGEIASRPLDRSRALWEVWLIEGFAPDRAAVVAKVHHCAVDGVSGFNALAAFFDLEAAPAMSLWEDTWEPEAAPAPADVIRHAVASSFALPGRVLRGVRQVASGAAAMVRGQSVDAPLPMSGPRLSFNRTLSPAREVAFSFVDLDDVKTIRASFGVTVNDVVMALCAGILRRHLQANGELPDRSLVAVVPTSEREPEHGASGNRFSGMFYALPVHLADAGDRLLAVQRSAAAAKSVYAAAGVGTAEAVANVVPAAIVGPMMRALSGMRIADRIPPVANVIVSNVRGPEFPLYVAGAVVEDIFPMGPLMEGVGLGVTVVSYRDRVGVGFMACPDVLPDVSSLAAEVATEVAALLEAAAAV